MSSVPAFISELIRAANEVEKLTPNEISRLLDRSVDTIRDMREQAGRFGSRRAGRSDRLEGGVAREIFQRTREIHFSTRRT